jgi:hypothetical protein
MRRRTGRSHQAQRRGGEQELRAALGARLRRPLGAGVVDERERGTGSPGARSGESRDNRSGARRAWRLRQWSLLPRSPPRRGPQILEGHGQYP